MVKQATAILLLLNVAGSGDPEKETPSFVYTAPIVQKIAFREGVMLAEERHTYATNLATYAANQVVSRMASKDSLENARRILALAFHLERRNKQAMVVNFQLREGVLPEVKKGDYNPRTFARLLLSRAKLLLKNANDNMSEKLLGRCFVELAAHIDPRNEDAVFEYENQRIDEGEIDWSLLTNAVSGQSSKDAEPAAQ